MQTLSARTVNLEQENAQLKEALGLRNTEIAGLRDTLGSLTRGTGGDDWTKSSQPAAKRGDAQAWRWIGPSRQGSYQLAIFLHCTSACIIIGRCSKTPASNLHLTVVCDTCICRSSLTHACRLCIYIDCGQCTMQCQTETIWMIFSQAAR